MKSIYPQISHGTALMREESTLAKILLVDDSLFALDMIARMVEKEGHQAIRATDGEQGLKKIKDETPDVVITDLLMPNIDGLSFLNTIRKADTTLPVIMLSANIQDSTRERCLEAGATAFLQKPPKENELLEAIERVT